MNTTQNNHTILNMLRSFFLRASETFTAIILVRKNERIVVHQSTNSLESSQK